MSVADLLCRRWDAAIRERALTYDDTLDDGRVEFYDLGIVSDDLVDCLERAESLAQPNQVPQLEQAKPAISKHVRHGWYSLAMSRRGPATGLVGVRRCAVQIRHRRWSGLDTISRTPLRNPGVQNAWQLEAETLAIRR